MSPIISILLMLVSISFWVLLVMVIVKAVKKLGKNKVQTPVEENPYESEKSTVLECVKCYVRLKKSEGLCPGCGHPAPGRLLTNKILLCFILALVLFFSIAIGISKHQNKVKQDNVVQEISNSNARQPEVERFNQAYMVKYDPKITQVIVTGYDVNQKQPQKVYVKGRVVKGSYKYPFNNEIWLYADSLSMYNGMILWDAPERY